MKPGVSKNFLAVAIAVGACAASVAFVRGHQVPNHIDPLAAQTMDMSTIAVPHGPNLVSLASVRYEILPVTSSHPGVVAAENVEVIAARVPGRIASLPFYPGDTVTPGDVVARLDQAELRSRVAEDDASLEQARQNAAAAKAAVTAAKIAVDDADTRVQMAKNAAIEARASADSAVLDVQSAQIEQTVNSQTATLAQRSYDAHRSTTNAMRVMTMQEHTRAQATSDEGQLKVTQAEDLRTVALAKAVEAAWAAKSAVNNKLAAQNALTITERQSAAADAEVDAAAAHATTTKIDESYATIASLAGGMVTQRPVALGSFVDTGAVLLRIEQIDRVRLQAEFPEAQVAGIEPGSAVDVDLPDGRRVSAKVTAIYPSTDPRTHAATVEAMVPNPHHALLPGALITMTVLSNAAKPSGLAPAAAIVDRDGQTGVWVARPTVGRPPSTHRYQCPRCGMIIDASEAKRAGGRCPMDRAILEPVSYRPADGKLLAQFVPVVAGRTIDGWTQIAPVGELDTDLPTGAQVVTAGAVGLSDGDPLEAKGSMP